MSNTLKSKQAGQPWWRFGMAWMVVAGPAVVVVASLTTFYLAVSNPDPVITDPPRTALRERQGISHAPAMQGRNHSATAQLPSAKDDFGQAENVNGPAAMPAKP